jgi:hypothetical protein
MFSFILFPAPPFNIQGKQFSSSKQLYIKQLLNSIYLISSASVEIYETIYTYNVAMNQIDINNHYGLLFKVIYQYSPKLNE